MTRRFERRFALPLLATVVALAGCIEDETIFIPERTETELFFERYVSLGNSLTAGFMSGGINDSTQRLAYPVLLADMADASFAIPSLAMPGCPPPLVGVVDTDASGNVVLETDRVGGPSAPACSFRSAPAPDFVQNVAVPGAKVADAWDIDRPGNASNTLTMLITGGTSQVEAMRRARPTFVTSWLGNNDVLGAALTGDPALLTPVDTFRFYHDRVVAAIASQNARGVVLMGIIDVTLAPTLQPGLYYWLADSLGLAPKPVSEDCGPTDAEGAANPNSMNTVSWSAYADPAIDVVSCAPDAPYVLTVPEKAVIQTRLTALNLIISSAVTGRDWLYFNPTATLQNQLTGPGRHNLLRRCEGLQNTLTPEQMVAVFTAQCPHPSAPNYFGSLMSYDGVHISAQAHQILANAIAARLESDYDLDF